MQPRQPLRFDQRTNGCATRVCRHRQVDQVVGLRRVAAVRVPRMLEEADHQYAVVTGDDVFGAVAVVHIEVDDGHALQAAHHQRVARGNRQVVDEAKANRSIARGVVARRAHRAEGVVHRAVDHRIGRGYGGTGCAAHRVQGARACDGVGVDGARMARLRHLLQQRAQPGDMPGTMRQRDRGPIDQRRIAALECAAHTACQQAVVDRIQPRRAFRMARAHVVVAAFRMAEEGCAHACFLTYGQADASVKVTSGSGVMSKDLSEELTRLIDQISTVIVGKRAQIRDCVACLLAGGHLLIEDVPGVGKTTLAHALSVSLGLRFSRMQFTADLMPTDLIGVSVYERSKEAFVFHPGPVFAQVLLADEINRAGPRTQSALLEAMEEQQVTVEGETRALPRPFFVIATQNPSDQLGTYPLPESQLDRFLMCITLGYPDRASERELLAGHDRRDAVAQLRAVMSPERLLEAQQAVLAVHVSAALLDYLQSLIAATRSGAWFAEGLSPRAGIAVLRAAKAHALLDRRDHVAPDDIQAVLAQTVAHRLVPLSSAGRGRSEQVRAMIEATPLP